MTLKQEEKEIASAIFRLVQDGKVDRRTLTSALISNEVNRYNPDMIENKWRCTRILKIFGVTVAKRRINGRQAWFIKWEGTQMEKMYSAFFHNGEFPGLFTRIP